MPEANSARSGSDNSGRVQPNRLALCASLLAFVQSIPVHAQNDATSTSQMKLEEVVVSARRRDEGLTEVPASITAYNSDFLERQNIQSFEDYALKIPNLSFQYGQGSPTWLGSRSTAIRGVAGEGTTAYYIDDTPVPSSVSPQVLNLERIEVLKGPQGTLFGSSSMGGNLRYISKKPSLTESDGMVQLDAGRTHSAGFDYDANLQKNFALIPDRLALNAAVGYMQESGFITRRFPDAAGNLVTDDDQGRNRVFSASVALRSQFTDELSATFSVLGQRTRLHGHPGAYVPITTYRPRAYIVDRENDVQEYSKDDWGLGAVVLNYAGDGFEIVSSTSYFDREIFQFDDNTEASNYFFETELGMELGDPIWLVYGDDDDTRFTHETRLSFDEGTIFPGFSGTVGVFYQRQRNSTYNPGIVVQELVDAGVSPPYMADTAGKGTNESSAIFGELYYEVLPGLNLTLGLRQYRLTQKQHASFSTGFLFGEEGQLDPETRTKESGLVPKVVISYEIGDRGNVYASASKGFRPGGGATSLPDFCEQDLANLGLTLAGAGSYESDTLWSYEVGAKSRLADGRVNASVAAFRMDWSGIQQVATLPVCGLTFTTNAGEARIQGAEFEVGGQPFAEVPLTLQFGVGYTDAKLLDPGFIAQAPNSRLALVPEWNGSISGYYEMPINQEIDWFVAADYSYTGSSKVPNVVAGQDVAEFVTRQPINLVNGNFGLKFGRSQVMFYVRNAFDKRLTYGDQPAYGFEFRELQPDGSYIRLPRGAVSRPRQLGLQYQLNF